MRRPRIVDGGLATGLESLGYRLHPRLWSAGLFLERPEAVEALHRVYLTAGAEILISASYQMSFRGLEREGLDHTQAAAAMQRTVSVARQAAASTSRSVIVAASVGPYGATRADGSEYTGVYELDARGLTAFHRERLEVLSSSGADLLAIETIPSLVETQVLCDLLSASDGPEAWVSFSCRDGYRLADGETIARAAALLDGCDRVTAVGVNCTPPQHVTSLIEAVGSVTGKRIVVYPNSGESWDAATRRWRGDPDAGAFVELARGWASQGVWAVGGCCRVGPETIRELARALAPGC
jgi:homocysteine S-methyltransferase